MTQADLPWEDPKEGWAVVPGMVGPPGSGGGPIPMIQRGPCGPVYEVERSNGNPSGFRRDCQSRIRHLTSLGYDLIQVKIGDVFYLGSRFRNVGPHGPRRWSGIVPLRPAWDDQSAGGCPWQACLPVQWTAPQVPGEPGQHTEVVTLYLRWRYSDPWQGWVHRYNADEDRWGFLRCLASPQLLPVGPPVTSAEGLLGRIRSFGNPQCQDEPGYGEDDVSGVREGLFRRAWAWLDQFGLQGTAWEGGCIPGADRVRNLNRSEEGVPWSS